MKARVHVSMKKTVLDPQGRTIQSALRNLGHEGIADVRQGKYFDLELENGASADQAREQVDRIAREVLANPVIEEYTVEIEE